MPDPIVVLAEDAVEIRAPRKVAAGALLPDEIAFGHPRRFIPRFRMAATRDEHRVFHDRVTLERGAEYIVSLYLEPYAAPAIGGSGATVSGDAATQTDAVLQLVCPPRSRGRLEVRCSEHAVVDGCLRATARIVSREDQKLFDELLDDSRTEVTCRVLRDRWTGAIQELINSLVASRKRIQMMDDMLPRTFVYDEKIDGQRAQYRLQIQELNRQIGAIQPYAGVPLPPIDVQVSRTDLVRRPTQWLGLIRRTVGRHNYYQSVDRPNRFYYVPDYYDLNADDTPHLKIRRNRSSEDFQIDYEARPRVDVQRRLIPHGRDELSRYTGDHGPVELHPLLPQSAPETSVAFRLNLPSATAPDHWSPLLRNGVIKNLHKRVIDSVAVTANALQSLFDAFRSERAVLFNGTVTVRMAEWQDDIDFNGRILGDKDAVWEMIFDDSVPADYKRTIEVESNPDAFSGNVASIGVEFRNGNRVTLTKTNPRDRGENRMDIRNFVLRKPDDGVYEYRVTITRTDGQKTIREWTSAADPLLHIAP